MADVDQGVKDALARAIKSIDELGDSAANGLDSMRQDAPKWVLATFLALNAGGLATAVNRDENLAHPLFSQTLFFVGVVLAIVAALWVPSAIATYLSGVRAARKSMVEAHATNTSDKISEGQAHLNSLDSAFLGPGLTGLGSGIFFLLGSLSYAADHKPPDFPNDRRCLALQRDMLSASPRKKDGAAMFQAFRCRPQGEGSVMVPSMRAARTAMRTQH